MHLVVSQKIRGLNPLRVAKIKGAHMRDGSHSRHSYPWYKMLPVEVSKLLTAGGRKVVKKLHNRKTRYKKIEENDERNNYDCCG
jgi:hypothetical protein